MRLTKGVGDVPDPRRQVRCGCTFSSCQESRRVLWEDQSFDGVRVGVLFFAVVGQSRGADPECKSLPLISRIRHEFAGWMGETLPNSFCIGRSMVRKLFTDVS